MIRILTATRLDELLLAEQTHQRLDAALQRQDAEIANLNDALAAARQELAGYERREQALQVRRDALAAEVAREAVAQATSARERLEVIATAPAATWAVPEVRRRGSRTPDGAVVYRVGAEQLYSRDGAAHRLRTHWRCSTEEAEGLLAEADRAAA